MNYPYMFEMDVYLKGAKEPEYALTPVIWAESESTAEEILRADFDAYMSRVINRGSTPVEAVRSPRGMVYPLTIDPDKTIWLNYVLLTPDREAFWLYFDGNNMDSNGLDMSNLMAWAQSDSKSASAVAEKMEASDENHLLQEHPLAAKFFIAVRGNQLLEKMH